MLPDFGWTELLVIAIVLIVVVGPQDLPKLLRGFSKTLGQMRRLAGDFRKQFDDALKDSELDGVRDIARDIKGLDPRNQIKDALNPLGKLGEDLNNEVRKAAKDIEAPSGKANLSAAEKAGAAQDEAAKRKAAADAANAYAANNTPPGVKLDPPTSEAAKAAGKKPAGKAASTKAVSAKPTAKKASASKPAAGSAAAKRVDAKPATTRKPTAKKTAQAKSKSGKGDA